ncbi:MAG: hypothetical protein NT159_14655 [Proteobacteria bacterium]|nr:hypothetical protein [Pseudomonadota bacterium]
MESIQTNSPVVARVFDYAQDAKRQRDLAEQASVKAEKTPNEQPANRVTFSQEAQTRLDEEKTHVANQVTEVRNAARLVLAEEHGKAVSEEHQKAAEARSEARQLREETDSVAQMKTVAANQAVADNRKVADESLSATKKKNADATVQAIELRSKQAKEIVGRTKVEDLTRTIKAQDKETSDLLEKQKAAVVVKNREAYATNNAVAVEHTKKVKGINDRAKAETDKAMKMYQHIDTMGRSKAS